MSTGPSPASKGPRPLRLASSAESPTITSPSPVSPSSAFNSKRNSLHFATTPRRQSSISYNPSSREGPSSPALFTPRHANSPRTGSPSQFPFTPDTPDPASLSRSSSVGSRSVDFDATARNGYSRASPGTPRTPTTSGIHSANGRANRSSTGSLAALELASEEKAKERPPLTLVEKHAELLHFIAQKESKCLELRSQLAAHEAELLQLKKKWERIVSRGFEKSQSPSYTLSPSSSSSTSASSTNDTSSTHPPSSSIYSAASLSYLENLSTQAQGAGGAAMFEALGGMKGIRESVQSVQQGVGRFLGAVAGTGSTPSTPIDVNSSATPKRKTFGHASSQSLSSVSTYATNVTGTSTRLSLSSQSSFGIVEEDSEGSEKESAVNGKKSQRKNRPQDIAIVSDTGATPLVSPTRDFAFDDALATPLPTLNSGNTTTLSRHGSNGGSMRSRRKSKTFSPSSPSSSSPPPLDHDSPSDLSRSDSEPMLSSPSLLDWGMGLAPSPNPSLTHSFKPNGKFSEKANKRMSLPARVLSPGSPENNDSGGGMGSWVGSVVGKRWEKTISKNQKRASLLLSDVSQSISQSIPQSIVQALVSPPLSSATGPAPCFPDVVPSKSTTSLLDEDIPDEDGEGAGLPAPLAHSPILPSPAKSVPMPKSPMRPDSAAEAGTKGSGQQEEDEDEWNW